MKVKKGDLIRYAGGKVTGQNVGIVLDVHYPHGPRCDPWVSVKWPTGDVRQPISIRGFEIITGGNDYE